MSLEQWDWERDWDAEERRLTRRYWTAVGWCLQYRIKVYLPGGEMKSLGQLEEELAAHEGRNSEWDFLREVLRIRDRAEERASA